MHRTQSGKKTGYSETDYEPKQFARLAQTFRIVVRVDLAQLARTGSLHDARGDEDDQFFLLIETERAREELADPGNVTEEGDLFIALGFLGLNQTAKDDGRSAAHAHQSRGLLGIQIRRGDGSGAGPISAPAAAIWAASGHDGLEAGQHRCDFEGDPIITGDLRREGKNCSDSDGADDSLLKNSGGHGDSAGDSRSLSVKKQHLFANLDHRRLVVQRANPGSGDHFDGALLLEGVDGGRGIEVLKNESRGIPARSCGGGGPHQRQVIDAAESGILQLGAANGSWEGRAAESERAAIGLDYVHPIDAKLKLIAEGDIVKFRLDLDLAMDTFFHAGEIILDSLQSRWAVGDLDQARGFVDGQRDRKS